MQASTRTTRTASCARTARRASSPMRPARRRASRAVPVRPPHGELPRPTAESFIFPLFGMRVHAGTFQNATGRTICLGCEPGRYADQAQASSCTLCRSGTRPFPRQWHFVVLSDSRCCLLLRHVRPLVGDGKLLTMRAGHLHSTQRTGKLSVGVSHSPPRPHLTSSRS